MTRTTLAVLVIGAALVVAGVAMVYLPAALVVAGTGLLVYGLTRNVPEPDTEERR